MEVCVKEIRVTILGTGTGTCALTKKEGADGLTVAFENEPQCFMSWRGFRQILAYKTSQPPKPVATAQPVGNGAGAVK